MKRLLVTALAAATFCAPALAVNAPDSAVVSGPNNEQTPIMQLRVTVPGQAQTTLGAVLSGASSSLAKFSSVASPIVSPETANSPNSNAIYIPAPIVQGYAETAGAYTYSSMYTSNLTVVGTNNNHWGQSEYSILLTANGGNQHGELNNQKNYLLIPSGVTVNTGENYEGMVDNYGIIQNWAGSIMNPQNQVGGTAALLMGYIWHPGNLSSTANVVSATIGFDCQSLSGGGSAVQGGHNQCIYNEDPKGTIVNAGHWSSRPDAGQPTLTNCGTGATLTARSGDDIGQITTGTGATACTLTFLNTYDFAMSGAIVIPSDGGTAPTYTYSTSAITISAARAGGVYQYWAMGGY